MEVNNTNPRRLGCSILLRSCLIITLILLALFMAASLLVSRLTSVQAGQKCSENMVQLASAIQRYQEVNGHRPKRLEDLRREYLKHPSVLRCPLDKSPGNEPSYKYNPNANDKQVMLGCDRHRFFKGSAVTKIAISGDGSDVSLRETYEQAEKDAAKKQRGDH